MDILKIFIEVGGLSTFIFAAVAQLKQFGLAGKWLTGAAYAVGLIFGGAYRYFVYVPVLPVDWFWLVVFGAAGGFIATGVYKGAENASGKTMMVKAEKAEEAYLAAQDEPPCAEDGRG